LIITPLPILSLSEYDAKKPGNMTKEEQNSFSIEGIHYATGNPVRIAISDGIIQEINEISAPEGKNNFPFLSPGLIDNQINGNTNVDFSGEDLQPGDVTNAAKAIWRDGVTTFLPTLVSNSHENLITNFRILDEALRNDEMLRVSVPGFHLEGPYISPLDGYRGCHQLKFIRKPSLEEFSEYQEAAGGRIIQVTIAPELEGAGEFIRTCNRDGIVLAMGHTNASAKEINEAVENGVRLSTHLGNGCANLIHRHNNPIWPQLANDLLTPSVIADGHHLLSEEIRVIYKVKGPENMILTSDIVYLAGMAPGKYKYFGTEVILTEEGRLVDAIHNCLAGASFPIKKGVENVMNFTGCSLTKAIDMASSNVARIYSLNDRGTLVPGKRADIIMFEREGNQIHISKTFLKGKLVYEK
jgi:N-acetylglucosamine-6-phosphate deacetylase